jgi:L-ribulose-5-phosphate 4-epimerase
MNCVNKSARPTAPSNPDRESGLWAIKPSGVDYLELKPADIVVLDLDGKVVQGQLRPSSDTKTHLVLYREFPQIGGVTHTHSLHATMFSQAGRELPCFGTTHADHFHGTVPVVRALTPEEVAEDYEHFTGVAIVERLRELKLDPLEMPAVLQLHHAPFTFGKDAMDSLKNSIALEMCAQMALGAFSLNPAMQPIRRTFWKSITCASTDLARITDRNNLNSEAREKQSLPLVYLPSADVADGPGLSARMLKRKP